MSPRCVRCSPASTTATRSSPIPKGRGLTGRYYRVIPQNLEMRARDEVVAWFRGFFDSMPDLHVDVEDVVVAGEPGRERVTLRWHLSGTHTGEPFMGIEATGRPVHLYGMDLLDFENGRIAGNCIYFDQLGVRATSRDASAGEIHARPAADGGLQSLCPGTEASSRPQLNLPRRRPMTPSHPTSRKDDHGEKVGEGQWSGSGAARGAARHPARSRRRSTSG